ncbi:MAG: cyclic nucleotide-binding domain-containing protein, partial [Candidatus Omnitrophica bacterium]|nr:cyclic nucleotide-binding domain-containing protein [Candidatus Omnitrophota bacterium]
MFKEKTVSIEKFLLISQQPFLCDLSLSEKTFLSNRCKIIEFKRGEIIYLEKAPRDFVYIIVKGQVELFIQRKQKTKTIHDLRIGDLIGLISAMTEKNHSCSSKALKDTKVIGIKHDDLHVVLKKIPLLALYVSKILSKRVRSLLSDEKKVYENNVITVFCPNSSATATKYTKLLKEELQKQGEKVAAFSINKDLTTKSINNKTIKTSEQINFIDKYVS